MNQKLLILFLVYLCSCDNIYYKEEIIHSNAELGKVCQTSKGDNLILSKDIKNSDKTYMSKLDSKANFIFHNK